MSRVQLQPLLAETPQARSAAQLMAAAFTPQFGEAWTERDFEATLALPNVEAQLAVHPSPDVPLASPIGFSLLYHLADEAEILMVAVDPAQRRTGVASALLKALMASARQRRHATLFLEVRDGNLPALNLYTRHGFTITGRRRGYYNGGDGVQRDAITMRCVLSP